MKKGSKMSEESKKKIGEAFRGKKLTEEHKRKIKESHCHYWTGKTFSEEHRKKIGKAIKGRIAPNKGIPHTEEHKRKISEAQKKITNAGRFVKGQKSWIKGRKHSEATKQKIRLARTKQVGEKHPNWIDGRSKNKNHIRWLKHRRRMRELSADGGHTEGEWETMKAQYDWTCPACKRKEPNIELTEDHVIPLSKGGSDNIENIQPLCRFCNSRKNTKTIRF